MDTGPIKNFAQELRKQLREGVKQRLLYWGFNEKGEVVEKPEPVEGGYTFRGKVFSDETVPHRWKQLKRMIQIHDVDYVIEEGAYTWFNRLMAIRILEKNNYIQPQLEYEDGTNLPYLLQNARRGIFPDMQDKELEELKKQLRNNKDNEAFARLLTHYCDSQSLISNVFGKISYREDYTELLLPQNLLDQEGILDFIVTTDAITDEDFEQVELIGWLYQFYITEKKDEVFKSFKKRKKAGPEELPAATQIFTPEWIVRYMVENTIGRLWMDLHPDSDLIEEMDYYVNPSDQNPKAEPIIEDVTDLTLLDPAAGSGHILVVGFEYLMEMYREEGYTARQSIENILQNNLYGLEIDERAAQLARFAVLLKAAKYDKAVLDGNQQPQIHSFPEKTEVSTAELREFLGEEGEEYVDKFRDALDVLQHGKNYGSTIQLNTSDEAIKFAKKRIGNLETKAVEDLTTQQLLYKVEPFLNTIELLQKNYKALAANPPYMGSRNMNGQLKKYLKDHYSDSKKDLFTVFIERGLSILEDEGIMSMITQQSWMFLKSYKKLRSKIIEKSSINSLIHLGANAFDEIGGQVVQSVAFTLTNNESDNYLGSYYRLTEEGTSKAQKKTFIRQIHEPTIKNQSEFTEIPNQPIAYWVHNKVIKLFSECDYFENYTISDGQNKTGNNSKFIKYFWEVDSKKFGKGNKWLPYAKGGGYRKWYGNITNVIDWSEKARQHYREDRVARIVPEYLWYEEGITWGIISSKSSTFRYLPSHATFDMGGPSLFFDSNDHIYSALGLCNSNIAKHLIGFFNPTLNVQIGDVRNLPVKKEVLDNEKIQSLVKDCLSISKWDWNSSEISWNFKHHRLIEFESSKIKGSLEKLREKNLDHFLKLHSLEEEINKILSNNYGLEGIVNSEVELDKITILENILDEKELKQIQNGEKREETFLKLQKAYSESEVIRTFLSYCIGCLMGRYRLKEGLFIASTNSSKELTYEVPYPLLSNQNSKTEIFEIDDDGLIPLVGSDGPFSDDIAYRVKNLIRLIWGEESLTENLNYIQKKLGQDLEQYLTEKFWGYHVKQYSKRPIYWLFSSKNGAFKVLAYMHRMDKYTVQKVRQNYLHPYMDYLRKEIEKLDVKDTLNSDESKRLDRLRSDLNECLEYDEVIKEVADKQIDFDLDDGVQDNYELFGKALAKI